MQRQHVSHGQMPEGAERYGASPNSEQAVLVPTYMAVAGSQPAPPSGIPWGLAETCTALNKQGVACGAQKAKGTQFCIGHLRRLQNMQSEGNEGGIPVREKDIEE